MTAPALARTCTVVGCVATPDNHDGDLHVLADFTGRDLRGNDVQVFGFMYDNARRAGVDIGGLEFSPDAARDYACAILAHADRVDLAVQQIAEANR